MKTTIHCPRVDGFCFKTLPAKQHRGKDFFLCTNPCSVIFPGTAGAAPLVEQTPLKAALSDFAPSLQVARWSHHSLLDLFLIFLGWEGGEKIKIVTPIRAVEEYTWGFENQYMHPVVFVREKRSRNWSKFKRSICCHGRDQKILGLGKSQKKDTWKGFTPSQGLGH